MVEWTTGTKLALVSGIIVLIGSFLPWWSLTVSEMGLSLTVGFNPIYGITFMGMGGGTIWYYLLIGLLAVVGGVLIILTLKKRALGLVGGIMAILATVLFMIIWQIEMGVVIDPMFPALGLFGSADIVVDTTPLHLTWYVTYGLFIVIAGAIIGLIAFSKSEELA